MNGPYLPITRKPKIIFSEWLENRKVHISKNKKKKLRANVSMQTATSHPNLISLLLSYFVAQYVLIIVV